MAGGKIMQSLETVEIDADVAGCDGGGGALGHPLVYLNLGAAGEVECPYCGRSYRKSASARRSGGGH